MNTDQIVAHLKNNPADLAKLVSALPREIGRILAQGEIGSILRAEPYAMQAMVRAEPYAFAKIALQPEHVGNLSRALAENPIIAKQLLCGFETNICK